MARPCIGAHESYRRLADSRRGVARRRTSIRDATPGVRRRTECAMPAANHPSSVAKKNLVTGYVLTALVALFLTFDTVIKVLRLAPAVQGTTELGYPAG